MGQSREQFEFGLKECVIEASPDFDESPAGQPPAKKTRQRKMGTKKERGHLVKEVCAFSLHELTTICFFGVLSIPQFNNALTTAFTNDFCKRS